MITGTGYWLLLPARLLGTVPGMSLPVMVTGTGYWLLATTYQVLAPLLLTGTASCLTLVAGYCEISTVADCWFLATSYWLLLLLIACFLGGSDFPQDISFFPGVLFTSPPELRTAARLVSTNQSVPMS